jgi:Fe-S-cluster containining protein
MKQCRPERIPADKSLQKEVLGVIYDVYASWAKRFPLACKKGCSACCTQSVTVTSLEGAVILDFVMSRDRMKWLHEKLAGTTAGKGRPGITTNHFAGACLAGQEVDGEALGSWDFTPCIFLEDALCSIYEVRPFGCRSFASLVPCTAERIAEIDPIHLTVNTVFMQIIEHVDNDGGTWATLSDMLDSLAGNEAEPRTTHIQQALPLPGFLLDPHELGVVNNLLRQLYEKSGGKQIFGDLIDNFMPI